MKAGEIIALVLLALALTACGPDGVKKPSKDLLLSEDKLVSVLTDIYLAAGILDIPEIRSIWGQRDSIENYFDVIEIHGCTYEQVNLTMQYYFSSKPRKMSRIYDRVTGNLLEMEARAQEEEKPDTQPADENLWTGKKYYSLPQDFTKDPIWFDIPVDSPGIYVLKADFQVFPDDKSLDPRVTVFFSITDTMGVEIRIDWDEVKLVKDGKVHPVEMRKMLEDARGFHIKGWLLNHTAQQGIWEKHATIRNVSLKLEKENVRLE